MVRSGERQTGQGGRAKAAEPPLPHSPAHGGGCVLCPRKTAFRFCNFRRVGPRNHETHGFKVRAWIRCWYMANRRLLSRNPLSVRDSDTRSDSRSEGFVPRVPVQEKARNFFLKKTKTSFRKSC